MHIAIGLTMVAVTLGIHTFVAGWWLKFVAARVKARKGVWRADPVTVSTVATGSVLLIVHFVEAVLWACVYLLPSVRPKFDGFESALYFSMVSFSTLGYGDITLEGRWRLLGGLEAMVGILAFGISTALLIAVIQRLWSLERS